MQRAAPLDSGPNGTVRSNESHRTAVETLLHGIQACLGWFLAFTVLLFALNVDENSDDLPEVNVLNVTLGVVAIVVSFVLEVFLRRSRPESRKASSTVFASALTFLPGLLVLGLLPVLL